MWISCFTLRWVWVARLSWFFLVLWVGGILCFWRACGCLLIVVRLLVILVLCRVGII